MGAVAAPIALISTLATAGSSIAGGMGTKAADDYQSERLQRAAEYGRVQAMQTSASGTEKLNNTLGNIEAVRAAGHTDPSSPTGAAIYDRTEYLGTRDINTRVDNIMAQVNQEGADSAYLQKAGSFAMTMGIIGAGAGIGKSIGQTNPNTFGVG